MWLGFIILQSPEKWTPWKFWLDSRFLRNSKQKWTLKWLPLNKGYFNFTFVKGEGLLIILRRLKYWLCRYYILYNLHYCHAFCSRQNIPWFDVLLINNPSKRGDVEISARSSVSPSSQVRVKLKLIASR